MLFVLTGFFIGMGPVRGEGQTREFCEKVSVVVSTDNVDEEQSVIEVDSNFIPIKPYKFKIQVNPDAFVGWSDADMEIRIETDAISSWNDPEPNDPSFIINTYTANALYAEFSSRSIEELGMGPFAYMLMEKGTKKEFKMKRNNNEELADCGKIIDVVPSDYVSNKCSDRNLTAGAWKVPGYFQCNYNNEGWDVNTFSTCDAQQVRPTDELCSALFNDKLTDDNTVFCSKCKTEADLPGYGTTHLYGELCELGEGKCGYDTGLVCRTVGLQNLCVNSDKLWVREDCIVGADECVEKDNGGYTVKCIQTQPYTSVPANPLQLAQIIDPPASNKYYGVGVIGSMGECKSLQYLDKVGCDTDPYCQGKVDDGNPAIVAYNYELGKCINKTYCDFGYSYEEFPNEEDENVRGTDGQISIGLTKETKDRGYSGISATLSGLAGKEISKEAVGSLKFENIPYGEGIKYTLKVSIIPASRGAGMMGGLLIHSSAQAPVVCTKTKSIEMLEKFKIIDLEVTIDKDGKCTLTVAEDSSSISPSSYVSNIGIEGCGDSLSCINCLIRKDATNFEKFTSLEEAVAANAGGEDKIYRTNNIYTALGCIDPSDQGIIVRLLQISLGIVGGITGARFGQAAYKFGKGEPESTKEAWEIIWSAILSLLLIAFSVVGFRFIGINLFKLLTPGTVEIPSPK